MEPLRVHLFGGFLLERGGVALPPIASRSGRSLFAYLAINRGRPVQRDLLAGLFWPDLPEGRARRRLSHALWQIQDVVNEGGASHLTVSSGTVAFDTAGPYWLDVEEFDVLFDQLGLGRSPALGRAEDVVTLRRAVELYRGDFMAGFFDDWVIVDQEHYRLRYRTALSRLVEAAKGQGAYEEALAHARRLTHHDPLREEAHQEVMRLCVLLGRFNEAAQQFERCRSVLEEELGSEPSPETVALYRRILEQRRATVRPAGPDRPTMGGSRPTAPFVGREGERRGVIEALERVLAGPGGVVLVEGEPGVGKTRLAGEVGDDARWRGFEVSWGSCLPGAVRPFGPLVEVLGSLPPLRVEQIKTQANPVWVDLVMSLVEPSSPGPGSRTAPLRGAEEAGRMQDALLAVLETLGSIAPHLIVVDDVQWADRDTLAVLAGLAPRLRESRLLLLLLYRSEEGRGDPEVWDTLRRLDTVAGIGRVVLAPLTVFELADMVKRVLGVSRIEPAVASQLHRLTGGNALFTLETLLAMRDRGWFEGDGDPAQVLAGRLAAVSVTNRIRSVIEERVALLQEEPAFLLRLAAVLGGEVEIDLLVAAAGLPRATALDALDDLVHRGLLVEEAGASYRLAHDQVREVVYHLVPETTRAGLHRRVAETLLDLGSEDVSALAHHFSEAGVPDEAARFLHEAGVLARSVSAYATARGHLETAARFSVDAGWDERRRFDLLGDLESVLGVLGERHAQEEVLGEMAGLTAGHAVAEVARRRAWLLAHTGRLPAAVHSARRAVSIEKKQGDPRRLATALVALGTVVRWSGRPLEAVPYLEEAVSSAGDDPAGRAMALTELASTLVEVHRAGAALPLLEEALSDYVTAEDVRGEAEVLGVQARARRQSGDWEGAVEAYERSITLCRHIGYRHGEGVSLVNLGALRHLRGEVAAAIDCYEQAARLFASMGNGRGEAIVLANSAALRHTMLGDDDRASKDAERARALFTEIGDRAGVAQCLEILAGVEARAGRLDEGRTLLGESLAALAGAGNPFLEAQHLRSLALLELGAGAPGEALAALDRADGLVAAAGLENLVAELLSLRGLALAESGELAEGLAATREAVSLLGPGVERPHLVHHRHHLVALRAGSSQEAAAAAAKAHSALVEALTGLGERNRRQATHQVPDHVDIISAWRRHSPRQVEVTLPAVNSPMGRPLLPEEMVTVSWTVTHPDDELRPSAAERRRVRLLRLLAEAGDQGAAPSIDHLAEALQVSASTVRRDLGALRDQGHAVATRGNPDGRYGPGRAVG